METNVPVKKKRGRKSKKELAALEKEKKKEEVEKKVPKKRGRKPKGGKIIETVKQQNDSNSVLKENVILHLKCTSDELITQDSMLTNMAYQPNINQVHAYNETENDMYLISNEVKQDITRTSTTITQEFKSLNNNNNNLDTQRYESTHKCSSSQNIDDVEIWKKIKELNMRLHNNKISDKNSSCFWCSCSFSNPPIYIPKSYINGVYEVYGSFCTPECAVGFLFRENIDSTTRWERYAMLNSIYSSIFKYKKNIKPAPEPYYILDKYYGTLSIEEYRTMLRKDKLLMVVDKPLTRVLPELYEDNNEFNINNSSLSKASKSQYKLSRAKKKATKHDVNFFNV